MDNIDFIKTQLYKLGLGKSETVLYLAGLQHDQAVGVQVLQKYTGLKRPTIYHNLDLLASKGLVAKVQSMNRTHYSFSPPEQLEHGIQAEVRNAKNKLKTLAQVMSQLQSLQATPGTTIVRHFEGIQGIKTVVDMALFCKQPYWKIIAPSENIFTQLDERYAKYYVVTRKRHGIKSQTLWEKPSNGRPLTKQEIQARQPRYLPASTHGTFTATTIIFDNKVAILTSVEEQSAILIESKEVNNLFSAMFNSLWEVSTPYEELESNV